MMAPQVTGLKFLYGRCNHPWWQDRFPRAGQSRTLNAQPTSLVGSLSIQMRGRGSRTGCPRSISRTGPTRGRGPSEQYTVSLSPKDQWHRDEKGVPFYRRFNCVRFVLAAYLDGAGISLIDTSAPEGLPEVGYGDRPRAYGERLRRHDRVRTNVGPPGQGALANLARRLRLPRYEPAGWVDPSRSTPFRAWQQLISQCPHDFPQGWPRRRSSCPEREAIRGR